jgi:hypothetical protein
MKMKISYEENRKRKNEKRKERAICLLRVPTNTVVFYNFDIGRSETGCLG